MKRIGIIAAAVVVGGLLGAGGLWLASRADAHESGGHGEDASGAEQLYSCAMHPTYIAKEPGKCPFCGMDLTPMAAPESPRAATHEGAIRIDPATVQNIGVRIAPVKKRELSGTLRAGGRIAIDEARQYSVTARVPGWAERLHATATGERVRKGQPLLDLYSPELVSTQEEYLQALRYARARGAGAASSEGAAGHAAEARRAASDLLESARLRLRNWEIPESSIRALEERGAVTRTLPIPSPADGVVLEKSVIQGQSVSPGAALYRIADLSRVWVLANIYQADLARVKVGTPAEIAVSYQPGRIFQGKVAFISPVLDPATRTAEVRVEAANSPDFDLKPEMFATVTLRMPAEEPVVAVPDQAIIRSGKRDIAVVALGNGYFEPREVRLGRTAEGHTEVLEGLAAGDSLVVSAQFLIDSESNLRAAIRSMRGPEDGGGAGPGGAAGGSGDAQTPHAGHAP
jgi:Cu(I)/Ag(I) efflux system membrane fusion protein